MSRYLTIALALSMFLAVASVGNADHNAGGEEEEHFSTLDGDTYYVDTDSSDDAVLWKESNDVPGLQTESSLDGDGNEIPADTPIA